MKVYRTIKKADLGEDIPNEELVAGFLASPWNVAGMRLTRALAGYLGAPRESDGLGLGWDPGDPDFERIESAVRAADQRADQRG